MKIADTSFNEATSDLLIQIVETQWLKSGEWGCPLINGPKLAVRQQICFDNLIKEELVKLL